MTFVVATLDLPPRQDGGIATLVDVLATGLHEIGEPVVVYARGPGEDTRAWDRTRPYPVVRMRGHSWLRHPSRNFAPYVLDIRRRHGAARILAASWQLAGAPAGVARRMGMPVSVLVYGREVTTRDPLPAEMLRADRLVTLTRWLAREARQRGMAEDRITAVHAAVHPPPERVDASGLRARLGIDDGPVVLAVGRLVQRKGQDLLVEAWPAVLARHPRARLLLVGQGPRHDHLRALIDDRGLDRSVILAGFLSPADLESAYELADLFALPCTEGDDGDTEGFGLVFLEAGVRGLPVIGGRTAGVVEAIEDGETGLLVEPGDVRALAAAILGFLSDPARVARMGDAGARRVREDYLPAHYARRIVEAGS
jgi:phosphatidyl-myo-inositol dimannoside synthase